MIYKYLLEVKYRTFFFFVAWSFLLVNCYSFKETLLYLFTKLSLSHYHYVSFCFLTTDVTEVFIIYAELSKFVTNQISFIFFCYHALAFISSGLYKFEYIYLKSIFLINLVCWAGSVLALNNFFFPACWNFFFKFQHLTFYFEAKLSEYWIFYNTTYHLCSITYQTVALFIIFLDLFKTNLLIVKKSKKVLYFIFFLIATSVTPPEVVYQLIISVFIIIIYELIVIRNVTRIELINLK